MHDISKIYSLFNGIGYSMAYSIVIGESDLSTISFNGISFVYAYNMYGY